MMPNRFPEWQAGSMEWRCREMMTACPLEGDVGGWCGFRLNENLHTEVVIAIKYEEACPINLAFLG